MFWNAETTFTSSPRKAWAAAAALPPSGSWTVPTFGGRRGTVTSIRIFPARCPCTVSSVESWWA